MCDTEDPVVNQTITSYYVVYSSQISNLLHHPFAHFFGHTAAADSLTMHLLAPLYVIDVLLKRQGSKNNHRSHAAKRKKEENTKN